MDDNDDENCLFCRALCAEIILHNFMYVNL